MNSHYYEFGRIIPLPEGSSFDLERAQSLLAQGQKARIRAAQIPFSATFPVLRELQKLWQPHTKYTQKMLATLPGVTGFSREMIELGLKALVDLMDPEFLNQKWIRECGAIPRNEHALKVSGEPRYLRYVPLGTVLHVLSGNVFLVGPGSLVEGILTGNVTLLKLPSGDPCFMPEFMETIHLAEKEAGLPGLISSQVSYFSYPSSHQQVMEFLKKEVDGIVLWGGEEAVKAYRDQLPARTRFVAFGPKLSVSVVSQAGLQKFGLHPTARQVSWELALWDQNACTAPQVLFLENGPQFDEFLKECENSLKHMSLEIPAGELDPNQAAEIQKIRSISLVDSALGLESYFSSSGNLDYTLYTQENGVVEPSPLHRTLKVIPFHHRDEVTQRCSELRSYLQTVGLCVGDSEELTWVGGFCELGVLRVVPLGQMTGGSGLEPHDGQYDLPQLMNLICHTYVLPSGVGYFETLPEEVKSRIVINDIKSSLFGREHLYPNASRWVQNLNTLSDLCSLPVMEKSDFHELMIKEQNSISKSSMSGGFVTRTGGSTGTPQFSYFDGKDWEEMARQSARVFEVCGLSSRSRIANCFLAGDLYGSFISFSAANEALGATQFALAGKLEPQTLVDCFKLFKVDVIQGLPTIVVPFLRIAKEICPELKFETMVFAGQPISESDKDWLCTSLEVKNVFSVIGTTEAGMIGYQNQFCKGNVHKLVDDYNWIEIINREGNPVPFGDVGMLCVTSLKKKRLPLVRFRIGDQARFVPSPDGFGRAMEFLGRADNLVGIGALNLDYNDVWKKLEPYGFSAMQWVCDFEGSKERIEIHLEGSGMDHLNPSAIQTDLLAALPKLKESLDKGLLILILLFHSPGKLPRNERTGKLKNIIDGRFS
jgi:phenylacetate-coenzyme A ligase PaaK-like adenylate-forming protein